MPYQVYNINRDIGMEFLSHDYQYFTEFKTTQRERRAILVVLLSICAGINMSGEITIRDGISWLGYKRSKQ